MEVTVCLPQWQSWKSSIRTDGALGEIRTKHLRQRYRLSQLTPSRLRSERRAHFGTCDQILILSEFCCLVSVGRPLWREVGSVSCQSLSAIIVHRQVLFFFFICLFFFSPHFTRHTFYVHTTYARPSQPRLSTADYAPSFVAYTTTGV
jgi:hypothetical protein